VHGHSVYDFDATKLPEAHARCMESFVQALMRGSEMVILDNTCMRRWEYHRYEMVARLAGYEVEIIEIVPATINELRECAERNVHRTPVDIVFKQMAHFEPDDRAIRYDIWGNVL